jgi:hypothetical protein
MEHDNKEFGRGKLITKTDSEELRKITERKEDN